MFLWVMAAYHNSPVLYFVPGVWSLVLYLVQLILMCVLFDCVRRTGAADFLGFNRPTTGPVQSPRLVISGWYAVVRHPLYLFSIIFLIINPVMTAQWMLLTILSTIYFVIGALIEEQRLVGLFGDTYRRYRQDVPFMVPWPKRRRRPPSS